MSLTELVSMIQSGQIKKEVMYFHTADDGKVYDYDNRKILLFDLKKMTGETGLPSVLKGYNFTSGYSQEYFDKCMREIEERKKFRNSFVDNYAYA